jgi:branched-chain amino acid transport system ATP-binding protein
MKALACHAIEVRYGAVDAVRGISFDVEPAESVALLGSNGAGKTSLVMAAMGVLRKTRGKVEFMGDDVTGWPAHKRAKAGLALVPEGRRVTGSLSVQDNLDLGAFWQPARTLAALREPIWELFPRLHERRDQGAGTLSGGEQQMLAIGRALMAQPKVIIMDEPFMGLAPSIVDRVVDVIAIIQRERNLSIVVVEQNARAALDVCTRGYLVKEGRIVAEGPASELRKADLADVLLH